MYHYASFYADFVVFGVPVGFVGDGHTVPPLWVMVPKSFSHALNHSLRKNMRLEIMSKSFPKKLTS